MARSQTQEYKPGGSLRILYLPTEEVRIVVDPIRYAKRFTLHVDDERMTGRMRFSDNHRGDGVTHGAAQPRRKCHRFITSGCTTDGKHQNHSSNNAG
jgi:hypothetical protein